MSNRAKIIELNDRLRTTFSGGQVRVLPSIYELDDRLCGRALCVMARSTKLGRGSEHDWGRFVFAGYAFEWHIEYRNRDGTGGSLNRADPNKTLRVLTLAAVDDLLVHAALAARK